MKNFKKALCLVLALAMTVAMLAACGSKDDANTDGDSAKKTFIMGVDPEYPPFSYLGDDGKFTGFDVEVAQAVCDRARLGSEGLRRELGSEARAARL